MPAWVNVLLLHRNILLHRTRLAAMAYCPTRKCFRKMRHLERSLLKMYSTRCRDRLIQVIDPVCRAREISFPKNYIHRASATSQCNERGKACWVSPGRSKPTQGGHKNGHIRVPESEHLLNSSKASDTRNQRNFVVADIQSALRKPQQTTRMQAPSCGPSKLPGICQRRPSRCSELGSEVEQLLPIAGIQCVQERLQDGRATSTREVCCR